MVRFSFINEQSTRTGRHAARVVRVIQEQPSWVTRAAFTAAFMTLTVLLVLVVLPVLVFAALIFVVLVLVRHGWIALRRLFGFDRTGRRNVRVIVR